MKIILAGGGTGGHLFPAVALAETFKEKDVGNEILFIGSRKGLEAKILNRYGFELETLDVEGVKGKGSLNRIIGVFKALKGIVRSINIIRVYKPALVIGTGGYSAFSVTLAAKLMGVKTIILEQNALPGITNRVLGKFADRVFVAFPEAARYFPKGKADVSGNPLRKEILQVRGQKSGVRSENTFTILVFGGSQGARAVNTLFLDAIPYFTSAFSLEPSALNIIHQTGEEDYERVKEAYSKCKMQNAKCKIEVFKFIDDMADAYGKADLIICRSGATSIAELTTLGKASILIPFPFAADNHQEVNARCLSDKGAAIMFRQAETTGKMLADEIIRLYENPAALKDIEERALHLGRPNAGKIILESTLRLLDGIYV